MSLVNSKIPLQANILLTTELSLRDIKAEMILSFLDTLLDDYKRLKTDKDEQIIINLEEAQGEQEIINKTIEELHTYCKQRITTIPKIREIFARAQTDKRQLALAKSIEPMAIYVDVLIRAYKARIKEGESYIPDYLGIAILSYYRDVLKKQFIAHPYIQEYNLTPYMELFGSKNMQVKRKAIEKSETKKRIWEEKTIIDAMDKIAIEIVRKYDDYKYKVTSTRVSKERNKKKKG